MVKEPLSDGMSRAHIVLYKYFLESTGEDRPTTMEDLIKELHKCEQEHYKKIGLPGKLEDPKESATLRNRYRNRVKKTISLMRDLDLDIVHFNGNKYAKYYMPGSRFSSPELSLLVDAVRTCTFLTEEQRESIVDRIMEYARQQDRDFAQKQIRTIRNPACGNPKTLDNMEAIHSAKLDERVTPPRRMTPVEIVYSDGFYYMIACKKHKAEQEEKSKQATKNGKSKQEPAGKQGFGDHFEYRTFRIDRMYEVRVSEEKAAYRARSYYQLNVKTAEAFGQGFLPGGKKEGVNVTLWVRRDKVEILTDRFGAGINLKNKDGGCSTTYRIRECEQFFGWVASLGGNVRILAPSWMREHYRAFLEKQLEMA